ncbi:MAG TPA: serine hydrolase domain-containing protein, partial [Gemmatimonadaceae bacterium]|nr:serine hydrolase domain-containing protein [Gemmatimonadaceae bacterium]
VIAVVKGNDTLLFKAYGKADVEWNVPMHVDAMFEIGSIAKQFTAVAILQLRDQGKLSLDDEITKWLTDFDTHGNKVTLRHLLNHTSGIHDFTETQEFPALVGNRAWPRDSAYALIKRYPFDFATGSAQLYSNSGFWLLGLVVEKASGLSYEDYIEKKIFEPLGMRRSTYCNSYENVERRAHGYRTRNGQIMRAPTTMHTWGFAAGALCSTAADMITWLKALHGGKVLSPASYTEMITPGKLNEWATLRYGMGLGVYKDFNGLQLFEHGGVNAGFWTQVNWYPESQTGIVVLTNSPGSLDPEEVAEALAWELLLDGRRPAATAKPFTGDPAPLVGRYSGRGARGELTIEVTHGPQGPMVSANNSPPRPLIWLDGWTFRFQGIVLTFHRSGNSGPATELGFNPAKGLYSLLKRQS